jgi:hypothetical protein
VGVLVYKTEINGVVRTRCADNGTPPLRANVGTNFADKRRSSVGKVRLRVTYRPRSSSAVLLGDTQVQLEQQ